MFSVSINGTVLDIAPGQEIVLESLSSLFTDGLEADGSELIGFSITPRNLRALGHADVIEVNPESETYIGQLQIGARTYTCKLRIQEVTETINAYVLYNQAELTCLEKNCRDLDWTIPVQTLTQQFKQGTEEIWPATPFYFPPILNPAFYDDVDTDPGDKINPNFEGLINQAENTGTQFEPIYNFIDAPDYINRNTLVPMIPVLEIFRRAFLLDGYRLAGDWPSSPVMARLFLYNNKSLDVYGDILAANATNILGYSASFTGDKLNFNATDNPTIFNLTLDQYEITEEGNFAFLVKFSLPQTQLLNGPIISLYEDGVLQVSEPLSGIDFVGGKYVIPFSRTYAAPAIGTKVDFRLSMAGTPQNVQINNISLDARKLIGTSLIQFSAVTNLAQHAPDVSFSKLLDAFAEAFQLHINVDSGQRIVYLNYRKNALKINNPKDLNGAALKPIGQNWQESNNYKIAWKYTGETDGIIDTTILESLVLTKDQSVTIEPALPEGTEAETIQPELEIMQYRLISSGIYSGDAKTLYLEERGQSAPLNLAENSKGLRVALFSGLVNGNIVATNTLAELNLIWRDNTRSIGGYVLPWLTYLQKSKRVFKIDVDPQHPLVQTLQSGDQIIILNNVFLVQRLQRTIATSGQQKVSLELRKV